jgi:hypothetical protein
MGGTSTEELWRLSCLVSLTQALSLLDPLASMLPDGSGKVLDSEETEQLTWPATLCVSSAASRQRVESPDLV